MQAAKTAVTSLFGNHRIDHSVCYFLTVRNGATWNFENRSRLWYTDGSKASKGVEVGVHGPNTNLSRTLRASPIIFKAEKRAIDLSVRENQKSEG